MTYSDPNEIGPLSSWRLNKEWIGSLAGDFASDLINNSRNLSILDVEYEIPGKRYEVTVEKPQADVVQQENPEDNKAISLCSISTNSVKRTEPFYADSWFDVSLKKRSFAGNLPLDGPGIGSGVDLNYSSMLENYAERYGAPQYFYSPHFPLQTAAAGPKTFEDPHQDLLLEGLASLLFRPTLFGGTAPQIAQFRQEILGWHFQEDSQENPNVRFNTGTSYSPESLPDEIHRIGILQPYLKGLWTQIINSQKSGLRGEIEDIRVDINNAINAASEGGSAATVLEKISYIMQVIEHASHDEKKGKVIYIQISATAPGITSSLSVFKKNINNIDYGTARKYAEGSVSYTQDLRNMVVSGVNEIYDILQEAAAKFGPYWYLRDFEPADSSLQISGMTFRDKPYLLEFFNKFRQEYQADLEEQTDPALHGMEAQVRTLQQQFAALITTESQVNSGILYFELVNLAKEQLEAGVMVKKVVNEPLLPLAVARDKGAFGEIRPDAWSLHPVPDARKRNFLGFEPGLGLRKEYNLELGHLGFGVGKHLYSQTLFPGEEVSIETHSLFKSEQQVTENSAEKIFEETDSQTQKDFNRELMSEFAQNSRHTDSRSLGISAEAGGSFGAFSSKLSTNYNWSATNEENEASKNVEKTLDKLASKLSDKRQVTMEINRTTDLTLTEENELKSTRKFSNINKEKTLTFNFFQVTREYRAKLMLQDIRLRYSSGKHRILRVFFNGPIDEIISGNDSSSQSFLSRLSGAGITIHQLVNEGILRPFPGEIAGSFAPGAVLFVLSQPFAMELPLESANAFLASYFDKPVAEKLNGLIWKYVGGGKIAPQGLGVAAFPFTKSETNEWPEEDGEAWPGIVLGQGSEQVVADQIVRDDGSEFLLANLDLKYSEVKNFRTRYLSQEGEAGGSLPLCTLRRDYLINTNGVYTENMLGKCGALEQFATDHRKLDVETKRLEVARQQALLPPDPKDFYKEDTLDTDAYGKAVELFERLTNADRNRPYQLDLPANAQVNVDLNLGVEEAEETASTGNE